MLVLRGFVFILHVVLCVCVLKTTVGVGLQMHEQGW
ncbi:hypothetical protein A2U01_0119106, partial [Trifolium medium]|nr:hypothetical protein [Trifolium medium]